MPVTLIGFYGISAKGVVCTKVAQDERNKLKEQLYGQLEEIQEKYSRQGPTMVLGDFNAKINRRKNQREEKIVGNHTFDRENAGDPENQDPTVRINRKLMVDFCRENEYRIVNTFFEKPDEQLVTYLEVKKKGEVIPWYTRSHYNQIDFVLIKQRWKNHAQDCWSDVHANITSDHFPVIADLSYKLKYIERGTKT